MVLTTALVAFCWGLANSPLLYITDLRLQAPDREVYVLAWQSLRVPAESSTLFYPVSNLERQVQHVPEIESVAIQRVPPHCLAVQVFRRKPVAMAPTPAGWLLIGEDGVLAGLAPAGQPPPKVPVLEGLDLSAVQPGQKLPPWPAWVAAQSTRLAHGSGLGGDWNLNCAQPFNLCLTVGGVQGFLGGTDNLERKIRLFADLLRELKKQGKHPAYIDVSVMERPVWREAEKTAPAPRGVHLGQ